MIKKIITVIFIPLFFICASCGPKTRTITPLSEADRTRIKKVAIHVRADDELSVSISNMKERFAGSLASSNCGLGCIFMIPVVIAATVVEESIRSNIDNKKAEEFREDISDIQLDKLIAERIDENFGASDSGFDADITVLQSPSALAQQGFDTLLNITIEKFEVKLCPKLYVYGVSYRQKGEGPPSSEVLEIKDEISRWNDINPKYYRLTRPRYTDNRSAEDLYGFDTDDVPDELLNEKTEEIRRLSNEILELSPIITKSPTGDTVRTWITFKGKMISTGDGRVLWEREEIYYDPKCESVEAMQSNPELVIDILTRAIRDIAVNTVNQIQ